MRAGVGCRGVRPTFPASAVQPLGAERWPCRGGLCGGLRAGSAWTPGPPGDEDPLSLAEQKSHRAAGETVTPSCFLWVLLFNVPLVR